MKCTIPEISWHNRDPVLSVDVQPVTNEDFYRLASGGTDSHVLIWHLKILGSGAVSVEPVCDLTRHQRAVNVVRWSPSGQYLASGDDDANIIIWQQKADDLAIMLDGENNDTEKWSVFKVLRGHKEDVYDICWSPNSLKLVSGSVDNTAIIWDLTKGLNDNILNDHKGFVQGVTWDPLGQFVATLSSDRTCRIFTETGKQVKARVYKGSLPVSETHSLHGQVVRYYHDDTLKSFFRRLSFSPDGNLLITPAGCLEEGSDNKKIYTSYIFTTACLTQPAAILPSPGQYTIAVKCCPILFQLQENGPDPVISLPYRIIIAVATRSSVLLYDTQQMSPFAIISNIHYTRLTDVTWSSDGRLIAVSSTDGFCSLVSFEPNELGIEYVRETTEPESEESLNETVEEVEPIEIVLNTSNEEKKDKKPSFLEQWTMKFKTDNEEKSETKMDVVNTINVEAEHEKENKNEENVLEISTPKKEDPKQCRKTEEQNLLSTPQNRKSTPAKLIAVRRKPRNEQMNITQFLKSPKQKPSSSSTEKATLKSSPVIFIPEDSLPREPWTNESTKNESEKFISKEFKSSLSEVTEDTIINQNEIIVIEDDSQDLKLILEDTIDESLSMKNKLETSENKVSPKYKDDVDIEMKDVNMTQKNKIKITAVDEIMEIDDNDIEIKEHCTQTEKTKLNDKLRNSEASSSKIEQNKCDINEGCKPLKTSINPDIKNEAVPSSLLLSPMQKKRVPLITLSSPKHNKNNCNF